MGGVADMVTLAEVLKKGMADTILNNPSISVISHNPRYQAIVKRLDNIAAN